MIIGEFFETTVSARALLKPWPDIFKQMTILKKQLSNHPGAPKFLSHNKILSICYKITKNIKLMEITPFDQVMTYIKW